MAELVSVSLLLEGIQFGGGEKLLLVLVNHIADHMDSLTEEEVKAIIDQMFELLEDSEGDRSILNLCLVVLSNMTVPERNAEIFCEHTITLGENDTPEPCEALLQLINYFLKHNPKDEESNLNYKPSGLGVFTTDMIKYDPWTYVGNIMTNIVRIKKKM